MKERLTTLKEARDRLLSEAKFWNRNRLFLVWAFCAAIILTSGIEIIKIISKNYYLYGVITLFVFGLVIISILTKILDTIANDVNRTYEDLNKIIKKMENKN